MRLKGDSWRCRVNTKFGTFSSRFSAQPPSSQNSNLDRFSCYFLCSKNLSTNFNDFLWTHENSGKEFFFYFYLLWLVFKFSFRFKIRLWILVEIKWRHVWQKTGRWPFIADRLTVMRPGKENGAFVVFSLLDAKLYLGRHHMRKKGENLWRFIY